MAEHGKTYATKSHLNTRFEVFSNNYQAIKEHNENPERHFEMEINRFSDMTHEEFLEHFHKQGLQIPSEEKRLEEHHVNRRPVLQAMAKDDSASAPEEVDWRKAGKVSVP